MAEFLVRAAQPHELLQIGTLAARVFTQGLPHLYNAVLYHNGEALWQRPGFQIAQCRVGVYDSTVVAHARVIPFTLRYGSAHFRVAGVSAVCTHPDYRQRGYASAVMRDTLAYMAEQGAHLSLLNGVDSYYRRFGFSPVWPKYYFEADTAEAAALEPKLHLRPAQVSDAPALADLYERHWGWRVAFVRSPENWLWRLAAENKQAHVVVDADGAICGYTAGFDHQPERLEVVTDTAAAAITVLAHYGRAAAAEGWPCIRWIMPPDDLFINYARQSIPISLSVHYRPSGGWMARLIDAQGLVETLLPEVIPQAQVMLPGLQARDLVLLCHPDVVEIGLRAHKTTFSHLNHQDFIQVMFGSQRAAALGVSSGLHPDAVRLLEALFPPRMAALAVWDWF